MPNQAYAAVMLCAGIGIPVLAALNASLGQRIGSPAAAGVILFLIAFGVACVAVAFTGPSAVLKAADAPPHLFLGGVLVAFYVLSITYVAPRFGVGNAVMFVLLGQLMSAAVIDHFGLFGAPLRPLGAARAAGISLMAAGLVLTQRG